MKTLSILKTAARENYHPLPSIAIAAILSASRYVANPTNDATPAQSLQAFFTMCAEAAHLAAGGDSTDDQYEATRPFDVLGLTRIGNSSELFIGCSEVMVSAKRNGAAFAIDLRDFFISCAYWAGAVARGEKHAAQCVTAALHDGLTKPNSTPPDRK